MADPPTAWQWLTHNNQPILTTASDCPTTISLRPWDDIALRYWLDEGGFASDRPSRERISQTTGNWPLLLDRFFRPVQSDQVHWEQRLNELDAKMRNQELKNEVAEALGLNIGEPRAVLQALAILDTAATVEELAGITDGVSEDTVQQSLRWAELLSLVKPTSGSRWQLDRLVHRLLSPEGE
jgi:hypothetical protein